jgi:lysophospholipase L1-like esterase
MGLTVEKCLQAWTNSLKQMNAKADIAFFGDSLTYYGDFSSVFPGKVVCNLGLRGDTIQGMIDRVKQVKILEPKIIYLMIGINDVSTCRLEKFKENYESLIQQLLYHLPRTTIYIQSMLPVNHVGFKLSCKNDQIVKYNKVIEQISIENNLKYIDLYSVYVKDGILPEVSTYDGLHLNNESYKAWYSLLAL